MKGSGLKDFLEKIRPDNLENEVEIVIESQGSIGGTPTVKIKNIQVGFDWDNKKILIYTDTPVIKLTQEELEDVRKSLKQAHSFHTRPLINALLEMRQFIDSLDKDKLTKEQKEYVESLKYKKIQ